MSATPLKDMVDLHARFIHEQDKEIDWSVHHMKMSGTYWGLSALHLLGRLDYTKEEVTKFVLSAYNEDGGFGGNQHHDSHMLYTLSAVQLLCLFDARDAIDVTRTAKWVASMQRPDGSFQGDKWGEVDTRFVYIALNCLQLLGGAQTFALIDLAKAVSWILSCHNWDGGFGVVPGAESHAGQIFCCVAALRIANALDRIDVDQVAIWLAMRQLPSGGLNGRPEKKADVCYSWWVVASLSVLQRTAWIDRHELFKYILLCQDADDGGFANSPGNTPDVYHTFFGLCGLSLLGYEDYPLQPINPVYALPYDALEKAGVSTENGLNVGRS